MKIKQKKPNMTKQNKSTLNTTMESALCWSSTPGHGACPGVWVFHPVTLHWRKLIFPFPFPSRLGVGLCDHSLPLLAEVLSGLNLGRSCACCDSLCEFMCALILLCLDDAVSSECAPPLALTIFLLPLPHR